MNQELKGEIKRILKTVHPSDAIAILESLGKELRKANSIRIYNNIPVNLIDMERPDIIQMK